MILALNIWDVSLDQYTDREGVFTLTVTGTAAPGDQIHLIFKAQADGHHRLVHYQQVIVTVNG